jgi:hypothetical protein
MSFVDKVDVEKGSELITAIVLAEKKRRNLAITESSVRTWMWIMARASSLLFQHAALQEMSRDNPYMPKPPSLEEFLAIRIRDVFDQVSQVKKR